MDCKYSYQGDELNGRAYLNCNITKEICPRVRFCSTKGKIVNVDNAEINCNLAIKKKELIGYSELTPDKVVIEKNGTLWVNHHELDQVFTIKNPYDYIPTYVKLIKKENELGEYSIEEARN